MTTTWVPVIALYVGVSREYLQNNSSKPLYELKFCCIFEVDCRDANRPNRIIVYCLLNENVSDYHESGNKESNTAKVR